MLGSGILSAFLLNDTLAIGFTPLTLNLAQALGLNPISYLLAIAAATNIGSVATLNGDPQNILIDPFSSIGYLDFTQASTGSVTAGSFVQVGLWWWLYLEVRSLKPASNCPVIRLGC